MATITEKLVEEVLLLPKHSRALLAEKLLESLDYEDTFEVSSEWRKEIHRRCHEIDEGTAKLIPASKVFDELDRKLG